MRPACHAYECQAYPFIVAMHQNRRELLYAAVLTLTFDVATGPGEPVTVFRRG
jgi:hypothetical protein